MVVFSNMISVGFLLTVTSIVLFSAALYLSLAANETVMMALPSALARILPESTIATLELLEV